MTLCYRYAAEMTIIFIGAQRRDEVFSDNSGNLVFCQNPGSIDGSLNDRNDQDYFQDSFYSGKRSVVLQHTCLWVLSVSNGHEITVKLRVVITGPC